MESSKKLLVLDLDNTLIFTSRVERECDFVIELGLEKFWVTKRPYLDLFLKGLCVDYDLAIWSASTKDYMDLILAHIIPVDVKLVFVYDRMRCVKKRCNWVSSEAIEFIKPLTKIWRRKTNPYTRKNTLIIDDRSITYCRNYGNALSIRGYYGDSQDSELLILYPKLKVLSVSQDVRLDRCIC
jgi:RNA polymerase II subunit A small phosphatase-like protein